MLKFNHLISKIIVKLQKGAEISDEEINSATITLDNSDMVIYKCRAASLRLARQTSTSKTTINGAT